MSKRLEGKVAIVCGAGQTPGETIGNGRATAVRLAEEGARVLCVDKDIGRAEETVAFIHDKGGKAFAFGADVSISRECVAIIQEGKRLFDDHIDILVFNVGIGGLPDAPADQLDEAVWDRFLDVNLKGAWMVIKAVLPVMRAQGGGAIVNVSSGAAYIGCGQTAYEISKAGLHRLTTNIAHANAKYGIRCNAVVLGLMDTPTAMTMAVDYGMNPDTIRESRDKRVILRGKQGTGYDTANAILFLASDEAQFITGAILPVDGGIMTQIGG